MVTIKFFGLIRSNHNLKTVKTKPQTLNTIINELISKHSKLTYKEFDDAVLFINNVKTMHLKRFDTLLKDGDEVIFTNFVGGG